MALCQPPLSFFMAPPFYTLSLHLNLKSAKAIAPAAGTIFVLCFIDACANRPRMNSCESTCRIPCGSKTRLSDALVLFTSQPTSLSERMYLRQKTLDQTLHQEYEVELGLVVLLTSGFSECSKCYSLPQANLCETARETSTFSSGSPGKCRNCLGDSIVLTVHQCMLPFRIINLLFFISFAFLYVM